MTNPIFNQWVVEYSVSQEAFHLEQVRDMVRNNLLAVIEERSNDFMAIGMFETYESASRYIESLKAKKYSIENLEEIPL